MFKITIEHSNDDSFEAINISRHYSDQTALSHLCDELRDMHSDIIGLAKWDGEFKVKKL